MFAKLYGSDEDQVLVKIDLSDDGQPEVRVFFEPEGLGVCSFAVGFEDSDAGWSKADIMFDDMTEENAREMVEKAKSGMAELFA